MLIIKSMHLINLHFWTYLRISVEITKTVFFKLGTRNVHHTKKENNTCCAITMTTVMLLVLF